MDSEKKMISAMIFDLDGTLVQTERLKAYSYHKAGLLDECWILDDPGVLREVVHKLVNFKVDL